jgi:hypothetical protein
MVKTTLMKLVIFTVFLIGCFEKVPIKDYSGIYESTGRYEEERPENIAEAIKIIKNAYKEGKFLRFSGNHHSQNGFSLPKKDEVLINTKYLNEIVFLSETEIRVGAGVNLWYLNEYLRPFNLKLPLINGGGAAPGLGGFISAGGISPESKKYGGFWENVEEITLIINNGKTKKVKRNDALFPWIFGSMGQLGLIVNAKLKMVLINSYMKASLPIKKKFNFKYFYNGKHKRPLYWFNFFLTKEQVNQGKEEFKGFVNKYKKYFRDLESYTWPIKFREFNPPLIFPRNETFICLGVFSYMKRPYGSEILKMVDEEFFKIVQKNNFGRYIQSERDIRPEGFRNLWGEKIYNKFYSLKKELDPKFLFNRGAIFKGPQYLQ